MGKLKQYKYIILIVLLILGFSFYWFQIRPILIIMKCQNRIEEIKKGNIEIKNFTNGVTDEFRIKNGYGGKEAESNVYNRCLREYGLEK